MITWMGTLLWALSSLFLGYWGVPIVVITFLGCVAGWAWKGVAVEIAVDTGLFQNQAEFFSKLPLGVVQSMAPEVRSAVAYSLIAFVAVSAVAVLILFLAACAFKVHARSPRTWASTLVSLIVGFVVGFVFVGICGLSLKALGYAVPVADNALLQYFFSVLIKTLA